MSAQWGTTGLIFNEPLLWEQGVTGRSGYSQPRRDVPAAALDPALERAELEIPDLSEGEVVRHYTRLSQWNFGVDSGMYPLGSCTMKYNPKTNERQAALPGLADAHPLLPTHLTQGALQLMYELQGFLAEITGLPGVSLQPAAGAQGELAGMLMIHTWHQQQGAPRTKILIPDTAHGTNPASAALCNYRPVPVPSDCNGVLCVDTVAALMDEETAGIMITNPNTLGLFEENIRGIAEVVHAKGGLVYLDGANLNAIMGEVDLRQLGVDVLHLNLHKTFSTPHGGGGPGAGPVCVTEALTPYLPVPRIVKEGEDYRLCADAPRSIGRLHAFYGNFGVLVKAYSYILSLGPQLKQVSQLAVLNANYLKVKLAPLLPLAFDRPCMHECVFHDEGLPVSTLDIAKRLLDYGFHAPTIYFPLVVSGAFMVEPTETETRETLDQFVAAVAAILEEARAHPEALHDAPTGTKVTRLDEVTAARKPQLCG